MKLPKIKRPVAILLIITLSICIGLAANEIWNAIDKKLHPRPYGEIILQYSDDYNVPEYVIYAVIKVESDFDPDAESSAGAVGLMQMIPSTFEWLTSDDCLGEHLSAKKLKDPEVSIKYGTYYLSYLYKKFDYNWDTAFAAYNGGEGNVRKWLDNPEYSDGKGNLTKIPFSETRSYVSKVNDAIDMYKKLYPAKAEIQ